MSLQNLENDCAASDDPDQSSLCAQWVTKHPRFLHVDDKDFDQAELMRRLI